eukprot:g53317.t1
MRFSTMSRKPSATLFVSSRSPCRHARSHYLIRSNLDGFLLLSDDLQVPGVYNHYRLHRFLSHLAQLTQVVLPRNTPPGVH